MELGTLKMSDKLFEGSGSGGHNGKHMRVIPSAPSVVQQARMMDAARPGTAWHAVKNGNLEVIAGASSASDVWWKIQGPAPVHTSHSCDTVCGQWQLGTHNEGREGVCRTTARVASASLRVVAPVSLVHTTASPPTPDLDYVCLWRCMRGS
jgi:hypothetical protein